MPQRSYLRYEAEGITIEEIVNDLACHCNSSEYDAISTIAKMLPGSGLHFSCSRESKNFILTADEVAFYIAAITAYRTDSSYYKGEYTWENVVTEGTKIPIQHFKIQKKDAIRFLSENNLPIPEVWLPSSLSVKQPTSVYQDKAIENIDSVSDQLKNELNKLISKQIRGNKIFIVREAVKIIIHFAKIISPEFNENAIPGNSKHLFDFITKLNIPNLLPPKHKTFHGYLKSDSSKGHTGSVCSFSNSNDSNPWPLIFPEAY